THLERGQEVMALTKEQLAENSRVNGSKSRGPQSDESKRKVCFNALKDGYYARIAPIPGVPEECYENYKHSWISYYNVQSPAALAVLNRVVRSVINFDRSSDAHDKIISYQMDEALETLEQRRGEWVATHCEYLATSPERSAAALRTVGL